MYISPGLCILMQILYVVFNDFKVSDSVLVDFLICKSWMVSVKFPNPSLIHIIILVQSFNLLSKQPKKILLIGVEKIFKMFGFILDIIILQVRR